MHNLHLLNNSDRKLGKNISSNNRGNNEYSPRKDSLKYRISAYSSKYGSIISQPLYMVECNIKIVLI